MPKAKRLVGRVPLEKVWRPSNPAECGVPLAIVDFRVALHSILHRCAELGSALGLPQPARAEDEAENAELLAAWESELLAKPDVGDWLKANWCLRLNRGPDMLPIADYRVVVVDDCKIEGVGYWRNLLLPEYKGNRNPVRSLLYKAVRDSGYDMALKLKLPLFSHEGYEADDWAGAVHRLKLAACASDPQSLLATRECYYITVDTDWLAVVDDASRQYWANTGPWQSRLKNEAEVKAYWLKKWGQRIGHPRDLAASKVLVGDIGDNLAVGSDESLFELTKANEAHNIDKLPAIAALLIELSSPDCNCNRQVYRQSMQWLCSKGLPVCLLQ
jgi:hypothetical protein